MLVAGLREELGREAQAAGMEPRRRPACSVEIREEAEEASGAASDLSWIEAQEEGTRRSGLAALWKEEVGAG